MEKLDHYLQRIRLSLGGAMIGVCLVGFLSGQPPGHWAPWAGGAVGFILAFLETGRTLKS